jgi:SET domain-containing protein
VIRYLLLNTLDKLAITVNDILPNPGVNGASQSSLSIERLKHKYLKMIYIILVVKSARSIYTDLFNVILLHRQVILAFNLKRVQLLRVLSLKRD